MKTCSICNVAMAENGGEFCSKNCFEKMSRVKRTCSLCKREFNALQGDNKKFCSRGCEVASKECHAPLHNKDCAQCGKTSLIGHPAFISFGNHFCSSDCEIEFNANIQSGKTLKEIRVAEIKEDKSVLAWSNCDITIPWIDTDGVEHQYTPDFIVEYTNGDNVVEDILGYRDINSVARLTAAKEYFRKTKYNFRILNRRDEFVEPLVLHKETYQNDYGFHERPIMASIWMQFAVGLAQRSTCIRGKVGAVITDAAMSKAHCLGYNGDEAGGRNQCDSLEPGKCNCTHAEINALSKNNSDVSGGILFVTTAPCYNCSRVLVSRQIKRVVYLNTYRDLSGIKLLRERGVEVYKIDDLARFE